ncbi:NUDIX hydrolase [Actinocrispum wychmicini]|uniref:NUDIX hydrolase n=1 Tax=Actinocrispum wychmicini TaxID=1213861 RepID=UPI001FB82267|nr:NUDIX hydrolase [Actinocrispum wychmicini]
MIDQMTVDAAVADARLAAMEFDGAQAWLRARPTLIEPLAAEVWAIEPAYSHVLLVRHRVRGWVPPGGTVESAETPRGAAARELMEVAGVVGDLLSVPAAVAVRSFRADWARTLGLSYGAVIGREVPLGGESGQPSKWVDLDEAWQSVFPTIASVSAPTCGGWRRDGWSGRIEAHCRAQSEVRLDQAQGVVGHHHKLEFVRSWTHTCSRLGFAANCSSLSWLLQTPRLSRPTSSGRRCRWWFDGTGWAARWSSASDER